MIPSYEHIEQDAVMADQTSEIRTLQNRLEAALRDAGEARQANQRKSEQIAAISHDIRTSMGAIISTTELLMGTDLDSDQLKYAQATLDSSKDLLGILNQILDLSKLEAGRLELECIPFDPVEVAYAAADALRTRIESKGLELRLELPERGQNRLLGDPTQLRQMLLNLMDNAIKFTDRGGITIRLIIKNAGPKSELRYEVIDTGIGLDKEQRRALFAPYQQANTTVNRQFGGTGLGLSLVKRLSEQMGGEAGVFSVKGSGSTFWFTALCPVSGTQEFADTQDGDQTPSSSITGTLQDDRPAHILVAEDNHINRMLITTYLDKFGHTYETVENGAEAVKAAESGSYDLILMDIHMPEMDGVEAAKKIRAGEAEGVHLPIIALTANAMKGDRDMYLAAGMDEYVSKPIDAKDLFMKIGALTDPAAEA